MRAGTAAAFGFAAAPPRWRGDDDIRAFRQHGRDMARADALRYWRQRSGALFRRALLQPVLPYPGARWVGPAGGFITTKPDRSRCAESEAERVLVTVRPLEEIPSSEADRCTKRDADHQTGRNTPSSGDGIVFVGLVGCGSRDVFPPLPPVGCKLSVFNKRGQFHAATPARHAQ